MPKISVEIPGELLDEIDERHGRLEDDEEEAPGDESATRDGDGASDE